MNTGISSDFFFVTNIFIKKFSDFLTKTIALLTKVVYSKGCKALHIKHVGFAERDQVKYIKIIKKGILRIFI